MASSSERRPAFAQVLVGLFIVWQLFFLLVHNFFETIAGDWLRPPVRSGDGSGQEQAPGLGSAREATLVLSDLLRSWSRWTGQRQGWGLFSDFPTHSIFVTIELDREGDFHAEPRIPTTLYSVFEPADPASYFHGPGSSDRLFHYEANLGWPMIRWDEKAIKADPDGWRRYIAREVRRRWKPIRAYLDWRLRQFQYDHPQQASPKELILAVRLYPSPSPGQPAGTWPRPIELPMARWQPLAEPHRDSLPVEVFDSITQRFEPLPLKD